jgi:hypothetical protein
MLARMRRQKRESFLLLALLLCSPILYARIIRVEVASRTTVLNGKAFGKAGAYERITGRVYFSLPIANAHNQRIVDLANAVNLKNGEVEFPRISLRSVQRMPTEAMALCFWKSPTVVTPAFSL